MLVVHLVSRFTGSSNPFAIVVNDAALADHDSSVAGVSNAVFPNSSCVSMTTPFVPDTDERLHYTEVDFAALNDKQALIHLEVP